LQTKGEGEVLGEMQWGGERGGGGGGGGGETFVDEEGDLGF